MATKTNIMSIKGVQNKSIGFILVLFILLVIVTSILSIKPFGNESIIEEESSGIEAAETFSVFNQTGYVLNLASSTNTRPVSGRIVDGSFQSLVLNNPGANGGVTYNAVTNSNSQVGNFSAVLSPAGFILSVTSGVIVPVLLNPFRIVVRHR
ncbi:hypothetical protein SAMN05444162_0607 [Paenibacillaceae bacterium GAS479]|nr:hypothetical protein SAMN05444162_0607 [Paenibacillaceae bacterium GAS479]